MDSTILVVDDEFDVREIIQESLELFEYKVMTATDGQHALEVLTQEKKPDLILLDLMMPILDGKDFMKVKQVKDEIKDIPVVVVSADSRIEEKATAMGADGYLMKPIDLNTLSKTVKYFLVDRV